MARSNLTARRIKPDTSDALIARVLRRERLSPHFVRITLRGDDLAGFTPMGFDQWFRLFLPIAGADSLSRVPPKLTVANYLKFRTVARTTRPVLRNYTVRAARPELAELDVDFVVHGEGGTAGPAVRWALDCQPDDPVAIIDEGIGFNRPADTNRVLLVADESGLPAVAGILGSLPADTTGHAIVEVPEAADRQELTAPPGVQVGWVTRDDHSALPGRAALAEAVALPVPGEPCYGWVVGESALPTGLRRHWVGAGIPKDHITFCGYWKATSS